MVPAWELAIYLYVRSEVCTIFSTKKITRFLSQYCLIHVIHLSHNNFGDSKIGHLSYWKKILRQIKIIRFVIRNTICCKSIVNRQQAAIASTPNRLFITFYVIIILFLCLLFTVITYPYSSRQKSSKIMQRNFSIRLVSDDRDFEKKVEKRIKKLEPILKVNQNEKL